MKKIINWFAEADTLYVTLFFFATWVVGISVGYGLKRCPEPVESCSLPTSAVQPEAIEWADGYFKLSDRLEKCGRDLINTAEDCSAHLICKDLPLSYINGFPSAVQ